GKALGAGFPISGLVAKGAIAQAKPWANPSGSSSSYGGNPLAAAAALASIRTLHKENVLQNVREVGNAMLDELRSWPDRLRWVGDVRGEGLFLGVELVADRQTKEPLGKKICDEIFQDGLRRGLLAMSYTHAIRRRWRSPSWRSGSAGSRISPLSCAPTISGRANGSSTRWRQV